MQVTKELRIQQKKHLHIHRPTQTEKTDHNTSFINWQILRLQHENPSKNTLERKSSARPKTRDVQGSIYRNKISIDIDIAKYVNQKNERYSQL